MTRAPDVFGAFFFDLNNVEQLGAYSQKSIT
jgi:hypothetical protein